MTTIAVAGGTGVLGREVVDAVRRRDLSPRSIARSQGVDLTTGEGLDEALAGVDAVVDASNVVALRAKPEPVTILDETYDAWLERTAP